MIDDFHARRPVDGNAAGVLRGGYTFVPGKSLVSADSAVPLPTKSVPRGTPDLTGVRYGRMTVIGMSERGGRKGAKWVVRCLCGTYSLRKTYSVKNPLNHDDMCAECNYVEQLKKKRRWEMGLETE